MKRLSKIDEQVFSWVASHYYTQPGKKLPDILRWVSRSADGHLYPVLLLLMYIFDNTHGWLFVYTAVMSYIFELPIYLFLKQLCKRKRPCDLLLNIDAFITPADKFSLPSGHTTGAFLLATVVSAFYPSALVPAYLWASMVGISRIVLRVHFPLDVIIGAGLGITIALISVDILA
jgi:undecaprenyl-diphosphatase|tara:strand:- start:802 stop:1326 length:525 start_codon:yes stop_codon:yes gene_type:complete